MGDKRIKYTKEFKIEAVRLLRTSGKSGREIEADLGIGGGRP
jgi:transposase-like protein